MFVTDDDVGPDLPPIADALREIEERAGMHDDDRPEHLDVDATGQTYEEYVSESEYPDGETVDGGGLGAKIVPADD